MSPAGIRHSSCVLRLNEAFNTERLAGRALVHVQNSMAASNISEPEPDVMLLAYREDRYASRRLNRKTYSSSSKSPTPR